MKKPISAPDGSICMRITKDPNWRYTLAERLQEAFRFSVVLVETEDQRELIERTAKRLDRDDLYVEVYPPK